MELETRPGAFGKEFMARGGKMMAMRRALATAFFLGWALAGLSFAADKAPEFTPANGFGGESHGEGSLRMFLGKPRPFHVDSRGVELPDGTFRLDQTVTFEDKAPKDRYWILSPSRDHRYTATLSDAAGRVTGETSGSRLTLKYRAKGPFVMHQTLDLSADGRTIDNVGVITLLGIPVGRLHETITRAAAGGTAGTSSVPAAQGSGE